MTDKRKTRTLGHAFQVISVGLVHISVSASGGGGIATIAATVKVQLSALADLISQIGFVAGFLFFMAAIFKFKQHKDNPTQVPVGTPVSMIVMSAALMFAGNFIDPLGSSIFEDGAAGDGAAGVQSGITV
jgi:intracellular multiplication protein IcmD